MRAASLGLATEPGGWPKIVVLWAWCSLPEKCHAAEWRAGVQQLGPGRSLRQAEPMGLRDENQNLDQWLANPRPRLTLLQQRPRMEW